jgi:hypothetical protein
VSSVDLRFTVTRFLWGEFVPRRGHGVRSLHWVPDVSELATVTPWIWSAFLCAENSNIDRLHASLLGDLSGLFSDSEEAFLASIVHC